MIQTYNEHTPHISESAYVAPSAVIIGEVSLADNTSLWPHVTVRGDMASITVGEGSNIQDNSVVHVNTDLPTSIGKNVTVGHGAIIHGCTIGDTCLIGMGAIILDGAVIGDESIVGAGSLVTPGKSFPSRSMIIGSPARVIRELSDEEVERIRDNGERYVLYASQYREAAF
ncbi:MAG: gamma carbonic anhydrase family protein [Sphaerochaetaceae bacterium]|nr:gamma carbonic anhydrase family protein [Sphaerochaetaceae bacterium]